MLIRRFLAALALTLTVAAPAWAAGRSAWTAGNGVGYTWTAAMGATDISAGPLANGSTVLSSAADITNQTAQDQFMDVNVEFTVGSASPPAGSYIGVYLVPLNSDGTTYGTGEMTSGSTITRAPANGQVCSIGIESAVATTFFSGTCIGVILPPGSFRLAIFNMSGAALSSTGGNNVVKYRTYNINLNN